MTSKKGWNWLIYLFCFLCLVILICQFSNIISHKEAHIGILLLCELFLLITLTLLFRNWVKKDGREYYKKE